MRAFRNPWALTPASWASGLTGRDHSIPDGQKTTSDRLRSHQRSERQPHPKRGLVSQIGMPEASSEHCAGGSA